MVILVHENIINFKNPLTFIQIYLFTIHICIIIIFYITLHIFLYHEANIPTLNLILPYHCIRLSH